MKKLLYSLLSLSMVFALWTACTQESVAPKKSETKSTDIANAREGTCGTTTWSLTAGQTRIVGTVTVSNDNNNLYVDYVLTDTTATFGTLHMWVGNSLLNLPVNKNGTPIPGQFCQSEGGFCDSAAGLTSYSFTIPFSSINWELSTFTSATAACGVQLFVVTHAEVNYDSDGDGTIDGNDTAFGGNTPGTGPRWWFYGTYTVCCDFGTPNPGVNGTGYAKGGWVWTTDQKSNPEKLPSLKLTKNRWGWAINLTSAGTYTYNLWVGAGLNNTKNGVLAGTVTVNWDGANAEVTYNLTKGTLDEVHLYADDLAPATIAPGQYGNTADPNNATTYTFNVPLADTNGTGGVWIVAHAAVTK